MNVVVIGFGAIGGYLGGKLMRHGDEVAFFVRQAAKYAGLPLKIQYRSGVEHSAALTVVDALSPAALKDVDVLVLAIKTTGLDDILSTLMPLKASLPPILGLTNGVGVEQRLAEALGAEKVLAATITTAVSRRAPGDLIVEKERGVAIAAGHALSARLVEHLNAAGVRTQLLADGAALKWSKLIANQLANPTSAILDMSVPDIFRHRGLFRLEMAALRETLAVMRALGLHPVNLPGLPIRLLVAIARLPAFLAQPLMFNAVAKGRGGKMPSLHIDLHGGAADSEVRFLHGAVAEHGARLGVPTPVNRFLTDTLLALLEGALPLDAYRHDAEKLLSAVVDP